MLKNAYFLAKIGADTAENEQHFAEILPIGRRVTVFFRQDSRRSLDHIMRAVGDCVHAAPARGAVNPEVFAAGSE